MRVRKRESIRGRKSLFKAKEFKEKERKREKRERDKEGEKEFFLPQYEGERVCSKPES